MSKWKITIPRSTKRTESVIRSLQDILPKVNGKPLFTASYHAKCDQCGKQSTLGYESIALSAEETKKLGWQHNDDFTDSTCTECLTKGSSHE